MTIMACIRFFSVLFLSLYRGCSDTAFWRYLKGILRKEGSYVLGSGFYTHGSRDGGIGRCVASR